MTTVAGAVVTIDGDSSGLVGALQKGENALGDVKHEAAKLSDQLREVTDSADKAAGALVQKIGGPAAIKAIAGVTAGLAAAKQVSDTFLDSAESLFKSFGDEGVKIWDDVEKSLFAVKGAFAEAVLGGGSMQEMGAKLKVMFETFADVVNFMLAPLRVLSSIFWSLRDDTDDLAAATDQYNAALGQTITLQEQASKTAIAQSMNVKQLYAQALSDLGYQEIAAQDAALQSADNYQQGMQEALGKAAKTAAKILSDGAIYVEDERDRIEGIILDLEESPEAMRQAYGALAKAGMIEEIKQIEVLRQAREKALARARGEGQEAPGTKSAGGAALKATADDVVYAMQLTGGGYAELTKQQADFLMANETMLGDYSSNIVEMSRKEFDQIEDVAVKLGIVEADLAAKREEARQKEAALRQAAGEKAQAELDAFQEEEAARAAERADGRLQMDKKTSQQVYEVTIATNAKMLAASIAANKSMSEIARAAIGNIISALGDKAMMQAGEMAAAGNFAQATAMAAAGTAAYTVAATLGAQKKPNAGPPTERQQPVQNYAYNLRIDAAFADSESISRRFAQMQEGARSRGLIAGAA